MVSTVKRLPNHYETLGLKPTASSDEIARAFAREISVVRPRAFGGVAQVSIAYETLRDPIKRRAYDASLCFTPEPKRPDAATEAERGPRWQNPPAPLERTLGSFIAASLREPASRGEGERSPRPEAQPGQQQPQAKQSLEPHLPDFLAVRRDAAGSAAPCAQARSIDWKRASLGVGGLLAVGLVSALAGLSGGGAEEPQPAEAEVTIPLPAATPVEKDAVPTPTPDAAETVPKRQIPAGGAAAKLESGPPPQQPALAEGQPAEPSVSVESPPSESLTEGATRPSAKTPPAQTIAANLPLSSTTIARTIERIGYACGEVASTSPVEGGARGVFRITCTSGQSYQARPVNGRYRFRRWDGR
jgi:hypothetical protein